jgi:hypothetical protein
LELVDNIYCSDHVAGRVYSYIQTHQIMYIVCVLFLYISYISEKLEKENEIKDCFSLQITALHGLDLIQIICLQKLLVIM